MTQVVSSVREEQHQRYPARLLQDIPDFIQAYMSDSAIIEIMANPDGSVWVDDLRSGQRPVGTIEAAQVESLLNVIASLSVILPLPKNILFWNANCPTMVPPVVERPIFSCSTTAKITAKLLFSPK